MKMSDERSFTIWTIGHSTRSLDDFLGLLGANDMEAIVDVRSYPGSRRYPHFNVDAFSESLTKSGMEYVPLKSLGGRRKASPDSSNTVWRSAAFRGYANYMDTAEFKQGIETLLRLGSGRRTAVMCAEAVWWRCTTGLSSQIT